MVTQFSSPQKNASPLVWRHGTFGDQSHRYHSNENTDPSGIFGNKEIAGKHLSPSFLHHRMNMT